MELAHQSCLLNTRHHSRAEQSVHTKVMRQASTVWWWANKSLWVDLIRSLILSPLARRRRCVERLFSSSQAKRPPRWAFCCHSLSIWCLVRSNAAVPSACQKPIAMRYKSNIGDNCKWRGVWDYCRRGDSYRRSVCRRLSHSASHVVRTCSQVTRPGQIVKSLCTTTRRVRSQLLHGRQLKAVEYWPTK